MLSKIIILVVSYPRFRKGPICERSNLKPLKNNGKHRIVRLASYNALASYYDVEVGRPNALLGRPLVTLLGYTLL